MQLSLGLQWAFQPNADADLRVVHPSTESLAHLRDAREVEVWPVSTPAEERLTCSLRGLPGGVGLSIAFALPHRENLLRIEVAPLPATSASHIADVWHSAHLELVDD